MRIYQVELTILSWEKVYQISERFQVGLDMEKILFFQFLFRWYLYSFTMEAYCGNL